MSYLNSVYPVGTDRHTLLSICVYMRPLTERHSSLMRILELSGGTFRSTMRLQTVPTLLAITPTGHPGVFFPLRILPTHMSW